MTQMNLHNFFGRLRSLYNVDGHMVADALSDEDQRAFVRDPVNYFIRTDRRQREAIWREIEKRNVAYDTVEERAE